MIGSDESRGDSRRGKFKINVICRHARSYFYKVRPMRIDVMKCLKKYYPLEVEKVQSSEESSINIRSFYKVLIIGIRKY